VFACSCASLLSADKSKIAKVKIIVVADDWSTKESLESINPERLAGEYCVHDRLARDIFLTLRPSGKFRCPFVGAGCFGLRGWAAGDGVLDKDGIKIVVQESTGTLNEIPLTDLCVLSFRKHYCMVQTRDLQYYSQNGGLKRICLSFSELMEEEVRKINSRAEEDSKTYQDIRNKQAEPGK
jgi:hypothetical protein